MKFFKKKKVLNFQKKPTKKPFSELCKKSEKIASDSRIVLRTLSWDDWGRLKI